MSPRLRSTGRDGGRPPRATPRGFTLIEVVVSLTILAMMAGTIFAIVNGSTQASVEIAELREEENRVEASLVQFREMFARMPGGATIELRIVESAPLRQELVVRGAPEAFVFGENAVHEVPELVFGLRRYSDDDQAAAGSVSGAARPHPFSRRDRRLDAALMESGDEDVSVEPMYFGVTTPSFYREPPDDAPAGTVPRSPVKRREGNQFIRPDREGRFWLELLPDVAEVKWRFYDAGNKRWLEKAGAGRPPLVELSVRLRGRHSPVRELFRPGR